MHRLGLCLTALRDLAKSNDPHRDILIERHIDEYLKADPFSLAHDLNDFAELFTTKRLKRAKAKIGASRGITFVYC